MYPSPNQSAQSWNQPGAPPPTSQPGQQPPPPPQQQWSPQPPNTQQYQQQPRPQGQNQMAPIAAPAQPGPAPAMQTQHDPYRLPPPQQMYQQPYQQQMAYAPAQPAPRQRTAIACRYCRRRKIRCSGFDQSEDGRCTNCQRFSQECVFTPVSAQTQAFVPAHTVWRGHNPPPNTQLYGAYGQPLPPGGRDAYPPPQQPGQYPPPPQGYQQQPMYQQPPAAQIQQGQSVEAGRKRPTDEPQTPTLPPSQRVDGQYAYPDPSGLTADKDSNSTDGMLTGSTDDNKDKGRRVDMRDVGVQVDMSKELGS